MSIKSDKDTNGPVFIGLSGGVDSAVAAMLLKDKRFHLRAIYLKCFDADLPVCSMQEDLGDAVDVAARLGIQFEVWDFRDAYEDKVLKKFYEGYQNYGTPNPDILCNSEIKFGIFLEEILKQNPDAKLATGHYARVLDLGNNKFLAKGSDEKKDQSYFLYKIADRADILNKVIFPLGEKNKSEVRKLARNARLKVASKDDSTGICFVGNVKLAQILKDKVDLPVGNIVDINGEVIGTHDGLHLYTIGQRQGFNLFKSSKKPLYVVKKDPHNNILVVGERERVYTDTLSLENCNIHPYYIESLIDLAESNQLTLRIRHQGECVPIKKILPVKGNSSSNKEYEIRLSKGIFAVAPGQSGVIYKDNIVVGGGTIKNC